MSNKLKEIGRAFNDYIPAHRKQLYFRVIDNYFVDHIVLYRMFFLDEHFPPYKLDRALAWLIAAGYTGKAFADWWKYTCRGSDLELHRTLLAELDKVDLMPIVAGKNFKV